MIFRFSCFFLLAKVIHVPLRILSNDNSSGLKSSLIRLLVMIPCSILAVFSSLTNPCVLKMKWLSNAQIKMPNATRESIVNDKISSNSFSSVGNNSLLCRLPTMPVGAAPTGKSPYFSLNMFLQVNQ